MHSTLTDTRPCLHRSDCHVQAERDPVDRIASEFKRKGRGFSSDRAYPFKPLGNPPPVTDLRLMKELHDAKLMKIEHARTNIHRRARVVQRHKNERTGAAGGVGASAGGGLNQWDKVDNFEDMEERAKEQQGGLSAPSREQKPFRMPKTPRNPANGYASLHEFVKESNLRLSVVKAGTLGLLYGLDYRFTMGGYFVEDYLIPNRKDYPSVVEEPTTPRSERSGIGAGSTATPRQVRLHRAMEVLDERTRVRKFNRCPGRPLVAQEYKNRNVYVSPTTSLPTQLPIQLPSLDAQAGGDARPIEQHEEDKGGYAAGRVGGEKDWQRHFRRKLEKAEKENWRELKEAGGEMAVVDGRQLSLQIYDEKKNEEMREKEEREVEQYRSKCDDKVEKIDPYVKVIQLMREHDPQVSPINRLKETLDSFTHIREHQTERLLQSLYSMDADRMESLELKSKYFSPESRGPRADPTVMCQFMRLNAEKELLEKFVNPEAKRQLFWYRDLLREVRRSDDRRNRHHPVIHFMFDYIRKVLEYGMVFQRQMLFNMLDVVENEEFTMPVSDLVCRIIQGVDQVKLADVLTWFKENRGQVPPKFSEAIGQQDDTTNAGNTFMTQNAGESA
eukprot:GEMP01022255.1.p1 GENE.GEMP01022255.1~~GEMP01022255.1.p1  ORF type:complete len:615 (+),score=152.90 GEMP01022255.1:201-2045(+)